MLLSFPIKHSLRWAWVLPTASAALMLFIFPVEFLKVFFEVFNEQLTFVGGLRTQPQARKSSFKSLLRLPKTFASPSMISILFPNTYLVITHLPARKKSRG